MEDTNTPIPGEILCRFPNHSKETRAYGQIIQGLQMPKFEISCPVVTSWAITREAASKMEAQGIFTIPIEVPLSMCPEEVIDIKFSAKNFFSRSISGCPFPLDKVFPKHDM